MLALLLCSCEKYSVCVCVRNVCTHSEGNIDKHCARGHLVFIMRKKRRSYPRRPHYTNIPTYFTIFVRRAQRDVIKCNVSECMFFNKHTNDAINNLYFFIVVLVSYTKITRKLVREIFHFIVSTVWVRFDKNDLAVDNFFKLNH